MTDSNGSSPYRFEILPLKQLIVDKYQRPLTSFVDKIANNFDPALVGVIIVSERSKTKFAIIDGQTRAEGMKMTDPPQTDAPCLVYRGLTVAQEADLFARFQLERRGMHSTDRFKAELVAEREHALMINEVVEQMGFKIGNDSDPNTIGAIGAVEYVYWGATGARVYREPDPALLADTLTVIKEAWPHSPEGARGAVVIRGLGRYLKDHPQVNMERLSQRLGKVQPSELGKRAQALKEGKGMTTNSPVFMAEAIDFQASKKIRA